MKHKPTPNADLIQTLIDTAVSLCEEKGQVTTRDLKDGNAQLIGYALHLAVKQGKLVKLGKKKGRFIYTKPKETKRFNWCCIEPFCEPYRVCGYGWPEDNERL